MSELKMRWLRERTQKQLPITFGTPWAKGVLSRDTILSMVGEDGALVPSQTKTLAFWPDGSVKWTAHSAVLDTAQNYTIAVGEGPAPVHPITAYETETGAVVESDLLSCRVEKGTALFSGLTRNGFAPASGKLVSLLENEGELEGCRIRIDRRFEGVTEKVTLEEAGPVRVVVRVEGTHRAVWQGSDRTVFPFSLRLYFYAGSDEVKIVHSFAFDADEEKDFLKGIALELHMEASGELYNRHVGFVGESGMFYEGVRPAYKGHDEGWTYPDKGLSAENLIYQRQQRGQFIEIPAQMEDYAATVADNACWNHFRLYQDSCDHYIISKRTGDGCPRITAAQGNRSQGTIFFGSASGMIAAAVKDCWQKSPMSLEIENAVTEHPVMTLWLWAPSAEPMDFRAYDKVLHPKSYGGMNNVPEGVANTNEITLKLFGDMPGKQAVIDFASDVQSETLLIAEDLKIYQETGVFGTYWAEPKDDKYRSQANERALIEYVRYYIREVEQRRWYGFWDYGDVMHTYDPIRHCWRYDVGGFAWHNTELCNTYVNWLTFLRTGDYDIYRFARAMSRHCSEVDTYHLGKLAMLGSRHNVRHWGCASKEPRISMAGHHRFYYYLTADERIGDVMDYVKDSDGYDQMGGSFPPKHEGENAHIKHTRIGPDWFSYASNWLTRWERFEDTNYRDKLLRGIASLKKAPLRMSSGSTFHYDQRSGELHYMADESVAGHTHQADGNYQQHMVICFGGPETWMELCELIDDPEMKEMLAQFGELYAMTNEERYAVTNGLLDAKTETAWNPSYYGQRTYAYAAWLHDDPKLMERAINETKIDGDMMDVYQNGTSGRMLSDGSLNIYPIDQKDTLRPMEELKYGHTNGISQWSLNYMETARLYEMLGEKHSQGGKNND